MGENPRLLRSRGAVAAEGPAQGVRLGLLAAEELASQLAEEQRLHCFHHSLGWRDDWQMALDGRLPL